MRGHTFSSPKRAISKRSFVFAVYGLQKDAFSPLTYAFERFFIAGIASEPNLFITCAQVTSEMTNVTAKKDNRQTASVKRRWRGNFLTCYNAFTDETIKVSKWVKACELSRSAKYKYLKTIKTTSLAGGMHRAFKANLLAASQDALNRNQSQLLPGNSQASHAFELLGFLCCFLFLSLASLELLEAKAFLFHQLSWWLLYAEANKAKTRHHWRVLLVGVSLKDLKLKVS